MGGLSFSPPTGASCDPLHPLVSSPVSGKAPRPPPCLPPAHPRHQKQQKEKGPGQGPLPGSQPAVPAESWRSHMLGASDLDSSKVHEHLVPGSLRGTGVQQGQRVQTPRSPRGWRGRWWLLSARIVAPETPSEGFQGLGPSPEASLLSSLSGPRMLWRTGWTGSCGPLCRTPPPCQALRLQSGDGVGVAPCWCPGPLVEGCGGVSCPD